MKVNAYAAFEKGGEFKPYEYELGKIKPDEVDVEIQYCGICHSDLSMIDSEWGRTRYPIVAGHEVVGVVSKLGDSVTDFSIGDNVGLGWHSDYCDSCSYCSNGDHNLCGQSRPPLL